jgi:hypothetical protein
LHPCFRPPPQHTQNQNRVRWGPRTGDPGYCPYTNSALT